jgi:uncharacterized membrane protein SirB2
MIEFYPQIKWVHVAAVLASGTIFLLRGLAVQANASWPMAAPMRYLSYGIDTVLLTAALMLLTILPGAVYANGWLTVKLTLLVVYIVLGTVALKRGRTRKVRLVSFVAALAVYGSIIAIARLHHPLGPLWMLVR